MINIRQAVDESREVLEMWRETQKHPDIPAFSGGLMDAWPALMVDGLAIVRREFQAISLFLREPKR